MWRVGAECVAVLQVGQLLTNLRVSSSNMLLPFTAQIMQLLQDDTQPAGERRQLYHAYDKHICSFAVRNYIGPQILSMDGTSLPCKSSYHDISHLMPAAVHCRHADK